MEKTWEYSTLMNIIVLFFLAILLNIQTVIAADSAVSYYYPAPNNIETYKARMRVNVNSSRSSRENIINMITDEFLNKPYPARVVIFAKGSQTKRIIIVSMVEGYLDTIYRARALLETMAPVVRRSPLFKEIKQEKILNFFDLLKISGFKRITVSDGKKFSYQVSLR
jgi:hypothetical protein